MPDEVIVTLPEENKSSSEIKAATQAATEVAQAAAVVASAAAVANQSGNSDISIHITEKFVDLFSRISALFEKLDQIGAAISALATAEQIEALMHVDEAEDESEEETAHAEVVAATEAVVQAEQIAEIQPETPPEIRKKTSRRFI